MREFQFKPGHIIAIEFSALGGVRYSRKNSQTIHVGMGQVTEYDATKVVDNQDLHKESKAIVGAAYYTMDKHCVNTPLGYYADADQLLATRRALAPVQDAARMFNELAYRVGSARRVTIEVYPFELNLDNEQAAKRLCQVVRERLCALHEALSQGDRKAFETAIEPARNLHRLATGIQADSVKFALDAAKEAKTVMLEALRNNKDPRHTMDLEPLEAAINLFTMPDDNTQPPAYI